MMMKKLVFKKEWLSVYLFIASAIFFLIALFSSCADRRRPYSAELKHTEPGIEYMPDMYRSPSYETYSANSFFSDSMTARKPVTGTIPRGFLPYPYPNTNEGYKAAGDSLMNPIPFSPEIVAEGKDIYTKFCMHCHGPEGNGDGILVKNGKFPPVPSYSTGASSMGGSMDSLTAGKIYHTIMYGRNLMGSHASQLNEAERWKVIHYVQQLQKGKGKTSDK